MSRVKDNVTAEDSRHPRRNHALFGQDAALGRAADAVRTGRPPQAWLISGPPGIGKATLAYRIARYLLRYGATADGPDDLSVDPSDAVSRQIAAGTHPGLAVVVRSTDDKGRLRGAITIDEIRRLGGFFGLTSGAGGSRVAIVDSASEMNDNAANALLKVLEEPPARALLILIAPAPGRLLPTIRSRCRRLDLRPLDEPAMEAALDMLLPGTASDEKMLLAKLSEGAPGLAVRLAEGDGLALACAAEDLIECDGGPAYSDVQALADRVARTADGLAEFGSYFAQGLTRHVRARAQKGDLEPAPWAELWERVNATYARAIGLHMEPRQTVISTVAALDSVKRRSGAY